MKEKKQPHVLLKTEYKYSIIKKSALFGLIRWDVRVDEARVGDVMFIYTETPVNEIYLDGRCVYVRTKE